MFRFYEYTMGQIPDFWKTYYAHTDLIKVSAFINQLMAAKVGGYELLQGYDLMKVGDSVPGRVIAWERLPMASYRYTPTSIYQHSYEIPGNILSIQTMHDKRVNPEITLQHAIDFQLDEDVPGILRLTKDIPTNPVHVVSGTLQGTPVTDLEGKDIHVKITGFDLGAEYAYTYTVDQTIDGFWTTLDELSVVNPANEVEVLTLGTDYVYDSKTATIKTKNKLPIRTIYIAKGTLVDTRYNDDYGTLLGFERFDSTRYRDNLVSAAALFKIGPSIANVKAVANLAFKLPLGKYGEEDVVAKRAGALKTTKYQYKLYGANTPMEMGDSVAFNQPLSDALTLSTKRTHPNWWVDRLPELFQKYSLDVLTVSRKNRMMEAFLDRYLAHVRLDLAKVDTINLRFQEDLWDLLFDGLPVRSDIIVSTYLHLTDLDMPMPNYERLKLRIRNHSIWRDSDKSINEDQEIPTRSIVHHRIFPEDEPDRLRDWFIGSNRYHIVGLNEQFKQFWSTVRLQTPYVEPCFSSVWHRTVAQTSIPIMQARIYSTNMRNIEDIKKVFGMATPMRNPGGDNSDFSDIGIIDEAMLITDIETLTIAGDVTLDYTAFQDWTLKGLWLGIDGIIAPLGGSGTGTSEPIVIGKLPKNFQIDWEGDFPEGTGVTWEYSEVVPGKAPVFHPIVRGQLINKVRNAIILRAKLTSNFYNFPVLREVFVTIRL